MIIQRLRAAITEAVWAGRTAKQADDVAPAGSDLAKETWREADALERRAWEYLAELPGEVGEEASVELARRWPKAP